MPPWWHEPAALAAALAAWRAMRKQQRFKLGLLRAFTARGIAIALPARRVHVAAAH